MSFETRKDYDEIVILYNYLQAKCETECGRVGHYLNLSEGAVRGMALTLEVRGHIPRKDMDRALGFMAHVEKELES